MREIAQFHDCMRRASRESCKTKWYTNYVVFMCGFRGETIRISCFLSFLFRSHYTTFLWYVQRESLRKCNSFIASFLVIPYILSYFVLFYRISVNFHHFKPCFAYCFSTFFFPKAMLYCNIARCGYHWQHYLDDKAPIFVIRYKHKDDYDRILSHVNNRRVFYVHNS